MLFVAWCGVMQGAIATEQMDKQKVQSEIRYVGYECDRVDDVQLSNSGNELKVTCDKVFKFMIRYERGGATVEVISWTSPRPRRGIAVAPPPYANRLVEISGRWLHRWLMGWGVRRIFFPFTIHLRSFQNIFAALQELLFLLVSTIVRFVIPENTL